jgi:hypothetical protein
MVPVVSFTNIVAVVSFTNIVPVFSFRNIVAVVSFTKIVAVVSFTNIVHIVSICFIMIFERIKIDHVMFLSSACYIHGYIFYKGICVKPSFSKKTWGKAKVDCEITGGQLISLDSEEKYNKTLEFVNNICKYKEFYCYFYGTTLMLPVPDKEVSDHVYLWDLDVSSLLRVSDWMLELL